METINIEPDIEQFNSLSTKRKLYAKFHHRWWKNSNQIQEILRISIKLTFNDKTQTSTRPFKIYIFLNFFSFQFHPCFCCNIYFIEFYWNQERQIFANTFPNIFCVKVLFDDSGICSRGIKLRFYESFLILYCSLARKQYKTKNLIKNNRIIGNLLIFSEGIWLKYNVKHPMSSFLEWRNDYRAPILCLKLGYTQWIHLLVHWILIKLFTLTISE